MLPTMIDEVFQPLRNEVIDIHKAWRLYRQAFATSEDRVLLLNRYAGVWFGFGGKMVSVHFSPPKKN
jgi:hypothetical protein